MKRIFALLLCFLSSCQNNKEPKIEKTSAEMPSVDGQIRLEESKEEKEATVPPEQPSPNADLSF